MVSPFRHELIPRRGKQTIGALSGLVVGFERDIVDYRVLSRTGHSDTMSTGIYVPSFQTDGFSTDDWERLFPLDGIYMEYVPKVICQNLSVGSMFTRFDITTSQPVRGSKSIIIPSIHYELHQMSIEPSAIESYLRQLAKTVLAQDSD